MSKQKLNELSREELLVKKAEVEKSFKELLSKSALSPMEKPHLKKEHKKELAQICTLLARGVK